MTIDAKSMGFKVGDKFQVIDRIDSNFQFGTIVTLTEDDGSRCPEFSDATGVTGYLYVDSDVVPYREEQKATVFSVNVEAGKTVIVIGKELTAAEVAKVLAAAGVN